MKTIVRKNVKAKLGYELVVINNDGQEVVKEITATDPKNENILKLPDNPSNRKWLSISKIGDSIELSYKESRTLNNNNVPKITKNWQQYLTNEEKAIFDELKAKCELRMKKDCILSQIEMYQKMLKECEN